MASPGFLTEAMFCVGLMICVRWVPLASKNVPMLSVSVSCISDAARAACGCGEDDGGE